MDKLGPNAHSSCRGSRGGAGEADPGGGRSGRRTDPSEGGGDVQHRGREMEEEECSAGSTDGCIHHCKRYLGLCNNRSLVLLNNKLF